MSLALLLREPPASAAARVDRVVCVSLVAMLLVPLLVVLAVFPVFSESVDFTYNAASYESARRSITSLTLPFWSPFFGGGYPLFSHPDDPSLSPFILLIVIFGAVTGLKVMAFVIQAGGAVASYLFLRRIRGDGVHASIFGALLFAGGVWPAVQVKSGNYNELSVTLVPLCLLLIGLALRGRKAAFAALPVVLYAMLYDGKMMSTIAVGCTGLLCAMELVAPGQVFGLAARGWKERLRPIALLAIAAVIAGGLLAVKVLPVMELISHRGGLASLVVTNDYVEGYGPHAITAYTFGELGRELVGIRMWRATVGPLPLVAFAAAAAALPIAALPWVVTFGLSAWLALAFNAPFDLFVVLRELPGFSAITGPVKYFSGEIVLSVAFGGALAFRIIQRWRGSRATLASAVLLGAALLAYAAGVAAMFRTYTLDTPVEALRAAETFYSVESTGLPRTRITPYNSNQYFNLARGVGTIDWYNPLLQEEHAVPRFFVDASGTVTPNDAYEGELFFRRRENLAVGALEAAVFRTTVTVRVPDILIVNQNFDPNWTSTLGSVTNVEGRLGVALTETGTYEVELRYRPQSFDRGAAISAATACVFTIFCATYVRRRGVPWAVTTARSVAHHGHEMERV